MPPRRPRPAAPPSTLGDERRPPICAPIDDVDIGVARGPRVGRAGQGRGEIASVGASMPPARRSKRGPQRRLPRPVGDARAVGRSSARRRGGSSTRSARASDRRREAACLAPRRRVVERRRRRTAGRLGAVRRRAAPGSARGTAGGGRTARRRWRSRRAARRHRVDRPRDGGIEPLADERVGVDGRRRLERDRGRQPAVVEDDDHRAPSPRSTGRAAAVSTIVRRPATGRGSCG